MLKKRSPVEDAPLRRAAAVLADPSAPSVDLVAEYAALAERYRIILRKFHKTLFISDSYEAQHREISGKLLRRFNKTVSISDIYQSHLMELKSRLEIMARTDLLTGLANRWEMVTRLEAEKSRAERHGKSFSIVIADIDHFKRVNDTYGHIAGDRVLRAIADTFRTNIRNEDICCRWGGEEFLFILPETDIPRAGAFAEKILAEVRKLAVKWEGEKIRVNVSIGYGVFTPGMNIDDCLSQVDTALSSAKLAGRDQAVVVGNRDLELSR